MDVFSKFKNKIVDFHNGKVSKPRSGTATDAVSKGHSRRSFCKALRNFSHDFVLAEYQPEDNFVRGSKIDIPILLCPECKTPVNNSSHFVQHIIMHHITPAEREICSKMRNSLLPVHGNKLFNEGIYNQAQQSYIMKKFENSDIVLKCSLMSPLASFLSLSPLKIYLDSQPARRGHVQQRNVSVKLGVGGKIHTICFTYTWVERCFKRLKNDFTRKKRRREAKEKSNKCARVRLGDEDIFFKTDRTDEEDRCLAKALGIEEYTKESLNEELQKFIAARQAAARDRPLTYKSTEDATGRPMTRDERRLISTLSDNLMLPPGAKRLRSSKC